LAHQKQKAAIDVIDEIGRSFSEFFGRKSGGLLEEYGTENAEVIIVAMGSIVGTIKDVVDELNIDGKFGVLSIISYRPFPDEKIKKIIRNAQKVVVVEKAVAVGRGGILFGEIELLARGMRAKIVSVIAGLGGREITGAVLRDYLLLDEPPQEFFLGLRNDIVNHNTQHGG
jgi:pyruvate ferredoxin oxidoreductase alpha subunit